MIPEVTYLLWVIMGWIMLIYTFIYVGGVFKQSIRVKASGKDYSIIKRLLYVFGIMFPSTILVGLLAWALGFLGFFDSLVLNLLITFPIIYIIREYLVKMMDNTMKKLFSAFSGGNKTQQEEGENE